MIPVIVEIGPFKIYSFGLMVVVAFLVGGWLTVRELERRKIEPHHMDGYPLLALVGGILGARLYYVLSHWQDVMADPFGSLLSGSGLTWYGGILGGAALVLWRARVKQQPLWTMCDAFAPGLAAAYGVGRIGCQLSGDGDYGGPSDLPWAMAYPKGIVPTDVAVHPTPMYEILMMAVVTWTLWRLRLRDWAPGRLFGMYLVLAGIERWIAEIFRVNPDGTPRHDLAGMSVAQWFSIAALVGGLALMASRRREASAT